MSTKNNVLKILLLNQPQAISGEKMARSLKLSRTAIWKAINELKKDGHHIVSTPNVGYQYISSDIVTAEGIQIYLKKDIPTLNISIEETLESTNQTLKKAAIDGAPAHSLLITNKQTKTRGRFGRPYFASEKEQGIYMSLLLHSKLPFDEVAQYTIITAVALAKAIDSLTTSDVQIKWVNDLYINGKKMAGILSEAITDFETHTITSIIIGIGINFSIPQNEFPEELQANATSIFSKGTPTCTRNQLIASFLNEFYTILQKPKDKTYLEDYRKRSFVLGKHVFFTYNKKPFSGIAKEITEKGELIVEIRPNETITLSSGEISLHKIE